MSISLYKSGTRSPCLNVWPLFAYAHYVEDGIQVQFIRKHFKVPQKTVETASLLPLKNHSQQMRSYQR